MLTTSDVWFKLAMETLFYRGGGINISGIRGMIIRTKTNRCNRDLGCDIGIKRPMLLLMINISVSEGSQREPIVDG